VGAAGRNEPQATPVEDPGGRSRTRVRFPPPPRALRATVLSIVGGELTRGSIRRIVAAAGQYFQATFIVSDRSPEDTWQDVLVGTRRISEYTVSPAGPNVLLLTRRYLPDWALMAAILLALSLIGLVLLWVRYTEVLSVSFARTASGTTVTYSGVASRHMIDRLNALLAALSAGVPPTPGAGWHQDPFGKYQYRYSDGAVWTEWVSTNGVLSKDALFA